MRAAVLVVIAAAGAPTVARADGWRASGEGGVEYDSNVRRVEVDPAGTNAPTAVPLARAGARLDGAGTRARWGRWAVTGQGLIRTVIGDVPGEDVGVVAGDARWDRGLRDRRVQVGLRASYYDALALGEGVGARTFAHAGADATIGLVGDDGARFVASAGLRDFRYKPDDDFDWRGVALAAAYSQPVWRGGLGDAAPVEPEDVVATLELSIGYRLDQRGYRGLAFTSGCAPGEPVTPACFVPTSIPRSDLYHVAAVELIYTGGVVASGGYQVTVNDSSSYGQSLVRHRITASATIALPARVLATGIVALQIDDYLDPLLLAQDVNNQTFTSIDEENRSAVSVRLSRVVRGGWAAEARWAFYGDSLSQDDLAFRRHVVYGGLTWTTDP